MKTHPRHAIAILLPALLILACSPGGKQAPAKVPLHLAPDTLADPTLGLADLKSYHVSFHQDVTGTQDGKAYESHTHIELTRASGDSDFVRELQGTDRSASYFRAIQAGKAVYQWDALQESCQGEEGALRQNEILDPAELLLPVLKTTKVGTETVNQISAIHYKFDQNALPITDPKPTATQPVVGPLSATKSVSGERLRPSCMPDASMVRAYSLAPMTPSTSGRAVVGMRVPLVCAPASTAAARTSTAMQRLVFALISGSFRTA